MSKTIDIKSMTEEIQDLQKKKDQIKNEILKIQAKKEAAEKALEDFRARCLEKKINPDSLEENIQNLYTKFLDSKNSLEKNINLAEEYLKNFSDKA